jgi:hypothetical protein
MDSQGTGHRAADDSKSLLCMHIQRYLSTTTKRRIRPVTQPAEIFCQLHLAFEMCAEFFTVALWTRAYIIWPFEGRRGMSLNFRSRTVWSKNHTSTTDASSDFRIC